MDLSDLTRPEMPRALPVSITKAKPDQPGAWAKAVDEGWEMITCPVCEGAKCEWCYDVGEVPTGATLRKYRGVLQTAVTQYRRAIKDANQVVTMLDTMPSHLVPGALELLQEDSVESVRARCQEDVGEWTPKAEKLEEGISVVDDLIAYFRELHKRAKKKDAPPPPPPPEPEPEPIGVQECEECDRLATVFDTDDDGNVSGYCKRHAHARGLLAAPDTGGEPDPAPVPEAPETAPRTPLRSFPLVGGPFNGTRQDIPQGEVAVWLPHGGREYRYDHHGARYVHSGSPDAVRDA